MSANPHASAFYSDLKQKLIDRLGKKPRQIRGMSDSAFDVAKAETEDALAEGDWTFAAPRHFVALYALLHEQVYGVEPSELGPRARTIAAGVAKRLLEREFGGDKDLFADYMRWAWIREERSHKWRQANGRETRRIGWQLCFGGGLVTDWRLATSGK